MSSLKFNGTPTDYVEVADNAGFSVATTKQFIGISLDAA